MERLERDNETRTKHNRKLSSANWWLRRFTVLLCVCAMSDERLVHGIFPIDDFVMDGAIRDISGPSFHRGCSWAPLCGASVNESTTCVSRTNHGLVACCSGGIFASSSSNCASKPAHSTQRNNKTKNGPNAGNASMHVFCRVHNDDTQRHTETDTHRHTQSHINEQTRAHSDVTSTHVLSSIVFPQAKADTAPIANRFLLFWAGEDCSHEVLPTWKDRYASTVWYADADLLVADMLGPVGARHQDHAKTVGHLQTAFPVAPLSFADAMMRAGVPETDALRLHAVHSFLAYDRRPPFWMRVDDAKGALDGSDERIKGFFPAVNSLATH